tara:strand:+ start:86 stop:223 length:138 start_codon:yes stop_codon:yes gene_type:complete
MSKKIVPYPSTYISALIVDNDLTIDEINHLIQVLNLKKLVIREVA